MSTFYIFDFIVEKLWLLQGIAVVELTLASKSDQKNLISQAGNP